MDTIWIVALLVVGLALLLKGGDWLVDGSSSLAARMAVPEIVIGLTVVSFGTSAPELSVNVLASIQGNTAIAFGNVIGSNIANILLILGIAGLVAPIQAAKNTVWKEIPFSLLAAVVLLVLCSDIMISTAASGILSRKDAAILLAFFCVFLVYTFGLTQMKLDEKIPLPTMPGWKIAAFILLGLVALCAGGRMFVIGAVEIAEKLNVSQKLIGLTIVAVGTSLPELVTSAVAAYKGRNDIAIGNAVGSCIFNIFFILGVSAMICPMPYDRALNIDALVLVGASFALFVTMFTGQKKTLDRWEAFLFLVFYIGYTAYLVRRG